jgi:hypothetical protein
LILPALVKLLKQKDFITKDQFIEYAWPPISKLCKAGEMPAQALYILVENCELFFTLVEPADFQSVFLPLVLKSLE